jgi:hypothetical protein
MAGDAARGLCIQGNPTCLTSDQVLFSISLYQVTDMQVLIGSCGMSWQGSRHIFWAYHITEQIYS